MAENLPMMNDGAPRVETRDTIITDAWRLTVPHTICQNSPLLVIPTVHPRGDRRIIRCAQVAIDAGFRVHFLWLGSGEASSDFRVSETLFSEPRNTLQRICMVPRIARSAAELNGQLWHIHDYYFLSVAKRWKRLGKRAVLYDVHEYYGVYYASKLPVPARIQRIAAAIIENYQVRSARKLGAANVVTEQMAQTFRSKGVPVSISPNYPTLSQFGALPVIPFRDRRWSVIHIGTLTREYGTQLLVDLAARSLQRGLPFEFSVVERFPSSDYARAFDQLLDKAGRPKNLKLVSARPTHQMPELLADAGFGLSLLSSDGQNEAAVPSKSYEHLIAGLVGVVTDRAAQRQFTEAFGVAVSDHSDNVDSILDKMLRLTENPEVTEAVLKEKAASARVRFTWEHAVEPGLRSMFLQLLNEPKDKS